MDDRVNGQVDVFRFTYPENFSEWFTIAMSQAMVCAKEIVLGRSHSVKGQAELLHRIEVVFMVSILCDMFHGKEPDIDKASSLIYDQDAFSDKVTEFDNTLNNLPRSRYDSVKQIIARMKRLSKRANEMVDNDEVLNIFKPSNEKQWPLIHVTHCKKCPEEAIYVYKAAAMLHISPSKIYAWIRKSSTQDIEKADIHVYDVGKSLRLSVADVENYAKKKAGNV